LRIGAALAAVVTLVVFSERHAVTLPAGTRTRVRDGRVTERLILVDPSPVQAASR
jgi:hypothetical protein